MAKKKKARKTKAKSRKPVHKRTRPKTVKKKTRRERDLEEGLRETFPGSDPLAVTDPTRSIKE